MINFDPNITLSGRHSKKTVKLTFGLWEARATFERAIVGCWEGLSLIDFAVEELQDELWEVGIVLITTDGCKLLSQNDEQSEEWLKDMLISAKIINIEEVG